jgi:hypothetical protein
MLIYAYTCIKKHKKPKFIDKGLLAVVESMEYFKRYLLGRDFILRTYHKALVYINEEQKQHLDLSDDD